MTNKYEATLDRLRGLSVQSTMDGFECLVEYQDVLTAIEALQLAQEHNNNVRIESCNAIIGSLDSVQNELEQLRKEREDALLAKGELLDALNGVMYWDNEKPEWEWARIIRDKYKPIEEDE